MNYDKLRAKPTCFWCKHYEKREGFVKAIYCCVFRHKIVSGGTRACNDFADKENNY